MASRSRPTVLCLCLLAACETGQPVLSDGTALPGTDGVSPDADGSSSQTKDRGPLREGTSPLADGKVSNACTLGELLCLAYNKRRICTSTAQGLQLKDETCAQGTGCVKGSCVVSACSDECRLGGTSGSKTCALWDMQTQAWVASSPQTLLHDRARAYEKWLRGNHLRHGGLGNMYYQDPPTYAVPVELKGIGDSALHTGNFLASEALRLMATGSIDARARVLSAVKTLNLWFNVSGEPGLLTRFAAPSATKDATVAKDLDCTKENVHCNVTYQQTAYDYIGHVSRDAYQGVMLGYALAYEALTSNDEATRELIRQDVVELVEQLMKQHTVTVQLTYNGTSLPALKATVRFMVLAKSEMVNGAILLKYGQSDSTWRGFQEFIPNLADVLKQVPLIGSLVPSVIPRSGSAIMLPSFFLVALLVTDKVPSYATRRAAIKSFYLSNSGLGGNVNDWLKIAQTWSMGGGSCGAQYYSNNIAMEPLYNLARLEQDPSLSSIIRGTIVTGKIWPAFLGAKNVFFTYISAANMTSPDVAVLSATATQLAGFGPPPRIRKAVDLRSDAKYLPHDSSCQDQVVHTKAVDVADRIVDDFIWQNHPWGLYYAGLDNQTTSGVDFLIAYWLGRRHGFLTDDTPTRCLRWK